MFSLKFIVSFSLAIIVTCIYEQIYKCNLSPFNVPCVWYDFFFYLKSWWLDDLVLGNQIGLHRWGRLMTNSSSWQLLIACRASSKSGATWDFSPLMLACQLVSRSCVSSRIVVIPWVWLPLNKMKLERSDKCLLWKHAPSITEFAPSFWDHYQPVIFG